MKFLPCITAILFLASSSWGETRLAIVADTDSQPLADLLTADLSKQKGLVLVERAEIDKVIREHQLSAFGDLAQQLNLSKLLRAQGILILESTKQEKGGPAVHAHLAAVEQGVVIFDMDAPLTADKLEGLSKLLSARVISLVPKLAMERGKVIPISILSLRSINISKSLLRTEQEVNALLINRLEMEPSVIVTERRRLDLLAGEKVLGEDVPGAFWNGAYLLDGSIEKEIKEDGDISIRVRMRKPAGGGEKMLSVQGPSSTQNALVEDLARQILKETGRESSVRDWNPLEEAGQYLDEAIWAREHGQYGASLEAVESAAALGLDSPDVVFMRTWLYAQKASSADDLYQRQEPLPLKERYDAVMKAIEYGERYLDEKLYEKLTRFDLNRELDPRNNKISQNVVRKASEVLVELKKNPETEGLSYEDLRQAIRKVAKFDPTKGLFPGDVDETKEFIQYWADSPDEVLYYYYNQMFQDEDWQKQVTAAHFWNFAEWREAVFGAYPDPKGMFDRLLEKMLANPRTQLNAYFLMSGGKGPVAEREAYFAKFLDRFWEERAELLKENMFENYITIFRYLDQDMVARFATPNVRFLRYCMVNSASSRDDFFKTLWKPKAFPPEQAADIWKEFTAYKERLESDPKRNTYVKWDVYTRDFMEAFPALKTLLPADTEMPPLTVTRFWQPYGIPGRSKDAFYPYAPFWAENRLWLMDKFNAGESRFIYSINLDTFESESIPLPKNAGAPVVTPDAIYVSYTREKEPGEPVDCFLSRYDRKAKTWEDRQIPRCGYFVVNKTIYLTPSGWDNNMANSSIARYDWATDKIIYLASSRRKPALNQFDDCAGYYVKNIFEGPGHKPCAEIDGKIYCIREVPGKWDAVEFPSTHKWDFYRTITTDGRTLVFSIGGDPVYYIDPAASLPVAWIGGPGTPRWEIAPDYKKLRTSNNPYALIPDGFYILGKTGNITPHYELRWYAPGGPRTGISIPLQFQLDAATTELLRPLRDFQNIDPRSSGLNQPEVKAFPLDAFGTARGVVLMNIIGGFWFIPYSDIEAHLKASKSETVPQPTPTP